MLRTHNAGEISKQHIGKEVTITGWVHKRRDHGGVIFIDLRDKGELLQVTFHPQNAEMFADAERMRSEFVLQIKGKVIARPDDMVNPKMKTGEVEIEATELVILRESKTPPFEIAEDKEVNEDLRLKYRYLDMRKERMRKNVIMRSKVIQYIRNYLSGQEFIEVETPILSKSTPEGARDYLVPSRVHPGEFFALPQSPQQYKQLLMVAGMDRYFQIARCMRDEDQRGDRQPEFTQLDMEMSFVEQEDILNLIEEMYTKLVKELYPEKSFLSEPWIRLTYQEAMDKYGCDNPDLRFGMEIVDLLEEMKTSESDILKKAKAVRGITVKGCAKYSRQDLDKLTEFVKQYGAKGLAWFKVQGEVLEGGLSKFLPEALQKTIITKMQAQDGDLLLVVADELKVVRESLGELRKEIGKREKLADPNVIAACIVTEFPLFEQDMEDGHYAPSHHMFTAPKSEDKELLEKDPFKVRSWQHDIVWNGYEVGGGSVRIHERDVQEKIFELVGFDMEKAQKQFGHLLEAFDYGVPPHGGIAFGLDRVIMLLQNEPNIREVIPFPKNQNAQDVMMDAPDDVDEAQLNELHIQLKK